MYKCHRDYWSACRDHMCTQLLKLIHQSSSLHRHVCLLWIKQCVHSFDVASARAKQFAVFVMAKASQLHAKPVWFCTCTSFGKI